MELRIYNKIIDEPIKNIILKLKQDTGGVFFRDILDKGDNVMVTCPQHKGGKERHPSCGIFARKDDRETEYGTVHCFTCGYSASLSQMVSDCFGENCGDDWLINNFGNVFVLKSEYLEEIVLNKKPTASIPESFLTQFEHECSYLNSRGISAEVMKRFHIGYDPVSNMVTFPVWDEKDNLVMVTKRSIKDKIFYIDKEKDKPVYLLNEIKKNNTQKVYVCESQINALTLWTWGYPAVALIGTGSKNQYEILNRSGIRNYILCLDGDEAGKKGTERFRNNIRKDVFVSVKSIPEGKDVNDLTKEEFEKLEVF